MRSRTAWLSSARAVLPSLFPAVGRTDNMYRRVVGYERVKTEHAGAKNGGGAWMTHAEAKESARRKRRQADGVLRRMTEDEEAAGRPASTSCAAASSAEISPFSGGASSKRRIVGILGTRLGPYLVAPRHSADRRTCRVSAAPVTMRRCPMPKSQKIRGAILILSPEISTRSSMA